MGTTFIFITMFFVVAFLAMVVIGEVRNKKKPRKKQEFPVLVAQDRERARRKGEQKDL